MFNVAYHLKKQKLKVPVSYVSAEPFAGHFGIGGLPGGEKMLEMFFKHTKIQGIFDVAMEEIVPGEIRLTDGKKIPFRYAMVVPPFVGADVVERRVASATRRGSSRSRTPTRRSLTRTCTRWGSPRP